MLARTSGPQLAMLFSLCRHGPWQEWKAWGRCCVLEKAEDAFLFRMEVLRLDQHFLHRIESKESEHSLDKPVVGQQS